MGDEHADEKEAAENSEKSRVAIDDNARDVVPAHILLYAYVRHIDCI
jgi:hypothetical protein